MDLETTFFVHREHLIGAPGNRIQPDIPLYSFSLGESCLPFFPIGLLKPLSVQSVQGQTAQKKWLKEKFTSLKRTPPPRLENIGKSKKRRENGLFYCRALKKQEWIRKWEGKAGCLKTPTKLKFGRYEFAFGRHETNTLIYDR